MCVQVKLVTFVTDIFHHGIKGDCLRFESAKRLKLRRLFLQWLVVEKLFCR